MKPASGKRMRAWTETQFSNFQLANSGYINIPPRPAVPPAPDTFLFTMASYFLP